MLPDTITIWDNGKTRVFRVRRLEGTLVITRADLENSILAPGHLIEVKKKVLAHSGTDRLLEHVEADVNDKGDIILHLDLPFLIEE